MSRQHTREEVPRIQFQEDIRPRAKESEKAGGADNFRSREGNTVNGTSDYLHGQSNQPNALGPNYVNDVDRMEGLESTMTLTKGEYRPVSFGQPFSADDLVRAMDQSTLKPAAVQA